MENVLKAFDPAEEQLVKMAEEAKKIVVTDLLDKEQLATVRENRIALKKARVSIENKGKVLREDANEYLKSVLKRQKELVAIIEPEEGRLESIEDAAELAAIAKDRQEKLPVRLDRIAELAIPNYTPDESQLLEMDAEAFEAHISRLVFIKKQREEEAALVAKALEADKKAEEQRVEAIRLAAERKAIEDEKLQVEREKAEMKAAELARTQTEERLKREQEQKVELARLENERIAAEQAEQQRKLARKTEYIAFLKANGYTDKTKADFKMEQVGETIVLYKKVGVFNK